MLDIMRINALDKGYGFFSTEEDIIIAQPGTDKLATPSYPRHRRSNFDIAVVLALCDCFPDQPFSTSDSSLHSQGPEKDIKIFLHLSTSE